MPPGSTARQLGVSFLGFLVLTGTGLAWLGRVPGIHYDEAWAANYAYRILTERGFWPVAGMSPYTHAWPHYLVALFFHWFGVSLFVYRAAGTSMCVTGALLAWLALFRWGERRAAMIFPFLLGLFVPFVLNERFSIDITSFQILCLGLLIFGAQLRSATLVFIASFFGVTSHVLFLAPVLALLAVWALQSGRWQLTHRVLVLFTALSLLPFFWKIFREIPEKDKAIFLLIVDALVIFVVLGFGQMPRWIRRMRENIKWFVGILSIPFFAYLVFFSEGHWSVLFGMGRILHPWVLLISVPLTTAGIWFLFGVYRRESWTPPEQRFWSWILFTVFLLGVLAVKPAPRYFSIAFFMMALGAAILLGHLSTRRILSFMLPFAGMSLLILCFNFLLPGLQGRAVDRSYRFLIFHDASSDTLPKQDLVRFLAAQGCDDSRVTTNDPRVNEALKFLSHGDWKVSRTAHCPAAHVLVARWAGSGGTPTQDEPVGNSQRFEQFRVTWEK